MVLHNIPYLNDSSKAEQAQPGSRLREMNLYSEIVRDTSINPVKQIGDLPARQCHSGGALLFHRVNVVSTPKYHPLFSFSPPPVVGQASRGRRSCREVTAQILIANPMGKTV